MSSGFSSETLGLMAAEKVPIFSDRGPKLKNLLLTFLNIVVPIPQRYETTSYFKSNGGDRFGRVMAWPRGPWGPIHLQDNYLQGVSAMSKIFADPTDKSKVTYRQTDTQSTHFLPIPLRIFFFFWRGRLENYEPCKQFYHFHLVKD